MSAETVQQWAIRVAQRTPHTYAEVISILHQCRGDRVTATAYAESGMPPRSARMQFMSMPKPTLRTIAYGEWRSKRRATWSAAWLWLSHEAAEMAMSEVLGSQVELDRAGYVCTWFAKQTDEQLSRARMVYPRGYRTGLTHEEIAARGVEANPYRGGGIVTCFGLLATVDREARFTGGLLRLKWALRYDLC